MKKVWGQGREMWCSRNYFQHPQTTPAHIPTCGVSVECLNCECTQTEVQCNKLYTTCIGICVQVWFVDVGNNCGCS